MPIKKVILMSVPYCDPVPLVAPALLAACLESNGIYCVASDFNIEFYKKFKDHVLWNEFKTFLTMSHLVDINLNRKFFKEVFKFTRSFIDSIVLVHQPTHIGLSIFTTESLDFGQFLSYIIRRYHPTVKIIAGGKGLEVSNNNNVYNYQIWADHQIADTVVVGDAETAIIDVIEKNLSGLILAAPQSKEDLDKIPLAAWKDYDLSSYTNLRSTDIENQSQEPYLTVTASKGCVRRCTFCDVASFWPKYIFRDPLKVADEIIFNYTQTGIKKFKFTDNLINGSISNFREMNQQLVSKIPNTISYTGFAIFRGKHQMPEEDFALAAQAGSSRWTVGVESGSERVRYDMKKKFNNQDLDWSVNMLYRYNIKQCWLLMVGYPSEQQIDFDETKQMLSRYQHLAHNNNITISIQPFGLLKNSPLLENHELTAKYGVGHNDARSVISDKFWTSTVFLDNTYPERSRRFKELYSLAQDLGYNYADPIMAAKTKQEVSYLDQVYEKNKSRIFAIHPV